MSSPIAIRVLKLVIGSVVLSFEIENEILSTSFYLLTMGNCGTRDEAAVFTPQVQGLSLLFSLSLARLFLFPDLSSLWFTWQTTSYRRSTPALCQI